MTVRWTMSRPDRVDLFPVRWGAIIAAFKSGSTKRVNRLNRITGQRLWQPGYYERAIRRQGGEYGRIAQYIAENPANWR